jgi:hypothetical protein
MEGITDSPVLKLSVPSDGWPESIN